MAIQQALAAAVNSSNAWLLTALKPKLFPASLPHLVARLTPASPSHTAVFPDRSLSLPDTVKASPHSTGRSIAAALIAEGRPATLPVAFIERATTDRDRVIETTLGDVARRRTEVHAPAVFVIGEVVRLRSKVLALTAEAAATA